MRARKSEAGGGSKCAIALNTPSGDAHTPEEVGMNFAEAIQLAHNVGYKECCRFAGWEREVIHFEAGMATLTKQSWKRNLSPR